MKNSFTLSKNQVLDMINLNIPYVIRIKVPNNLNIVINDLLRGQIVINSYKKI